jgi:hypothetical protein
MINIIIILPYLYRLVITNIIAKPNKLTQMKQALKIAKQNKTIKIKSIKKYINSSVSKVTIYFIAKYHLDDKKIKRNYYHLLYNENNLINRL